VALGTSVWVKVGMGEALGTSVAALAVEVGRVVVLSVQLVRRRHRLTTMVRMKQIPALLDLILLSLHGRTTYLAVNLE